MIKRDSQLDDVLNDLRNRDWVSFDQHATIIKLLLEENVRIIEAVNKLETRKAKQ